LPDESDALREVRARLDDAHAAADRLVREAQRQAEEADGPPPRPHVPPRGWASEGDGRGAGAAAGGVDPAALLALIELVRDAVPPELSQQLAEAVRDLLVALRALLDHAIERLGDPAPGPARVEVEDIPLDD
jgi:hypothetical protein